MTVHHLVRQLVQTRVSTRVWEAVMVHVIRSAPGIVKARVRAVKTHVWDVPINARVTVRRLVETIVVGHALMDVRSHASVVRTRLL